MVAQGFIGSECGMREIIGRIALHAESLHHSLGAQIRGCGERDDLVETEAPKGEVRGGVRSFAGESLSPEAACQTPSDLYTGSEVCFEAGMRQADEAGVSCKPWNFHHP